MRNIIKPPLELPVKVAHDPYFPVLRSAVCFYDLFRKYNGPKVERYLQRLSNVEFQSSDMFIYSVILTMVSSPNFGAFQVLLCSTQTERQRAYLL
jgi:hypothetical protein